MKANVVVWNESGQGTEAYPDGMGNCIAKSLEETGLFASVKTAALDEADHGLSDGVLNTADVLFWWGHMYHGRVSDETVEKVKRRVLDGMGLVALHSSHASKIFNRLMGTDTVRLRWRDVGERERVWTVCPNHMIAAGVPEYFDIPRSEMYGEHFDIPAPDELIFISWYEGGEVFRSGCAYRRGLGKVFYFSPGHEEYSIYCIPEIKRILANAAVWAAPNGYPDILTGHTPVSPESVYK